MQQSPAHMNIFKITVTAVSACNGTLDTGICGGLTPQSALGSKFSLQAMKDWHKLKPELFKEQPYYRW